MNIRVETEKSPSQEKRATAIKENGLAPGKDAALPPHDAGRAGAEPTDEYLRIDVC
ncbi:MAG: hypothetical protein AB7E05_02375 [Sphingobium sp.]